MLEAQMDLFNPSKNVDAICITTNGVIRYDGRLVMGKGVALAAREKFNGIDGRLGTLVKNNGNHVYLAWVWLHNNKPVFVLSFPTKNNWKDKSTIELITQSAKELLSVVNELGLSKVILPRPGCANGGLNWLEVKKAISFLDDRFIIVTRS